MSKLSQQLNKEATSKSESEQANGFIEKTPIYVTAYPPSQTTTSTTTAKPSTASSPGAPPTQDLELTQELPPASAPTPAQAPAPPGRTEVLIGQDVTPTDTKVKTTAIVENHRGLSVTDDSAARPRRRSGSSIVVVGQEDAEPVKRPPDAETDDAYKMMMMMAACDNGPHREMAVDVPESWAPKNKTPPRYPPPRPQARIQPAVNGTARTDPDVGGGKPVPPPRDHLRIEKDGRLVSRAPPPQLPARLTDNINNNTPTTPPTPAPAPTSAELNSIRKFQEVKRRERAEKERVAAQNEFLNRSLRGSKKLQALESGTTGVDNDAFSQDETQVADAGVSDTDDVFEDTLHKVISYGELVASLQRLQLQLKKAGPSYCALEAQAGAVATLLLSPGFGRALTVHNRVQQTWPQHRTHRPVTSNSQTLVRDCVELLQPSTQPEAAELCELLMRYEVEGLLYTHDTITRELEDHSPVMTPNTVNHSPPPLPVHEHEDQDSNIKIIKIEKTNEPLGATVRNEGEAVIIGRVVRGGAAEKSGLLHEGDEVLEVNGIEMRGKSVNDVCDLLSTMTGTLTFLIVPSQNRTSRRTSSARDSIVHVKAHFDYDPEDDLYIPCRELGISFQKGDVLHVICQDDSNWWQAYREGEEDQTLAGLIPSRSFQHQRESLKQTITGDKIGREKSKKAGTFLCAKKTPKKKKKKMPYSTNYNDGGYPIYHTTSADEYEAEEILTYEEVALYYPRANHKRPIVLIGPPNIGRHELRQRLMEDSERFAAAIPHTSRTRKDGEVDGQDYHFITRAQFEADILSRKFVEHGEYERAYYGTSLDAIRSVVNAGKICVLNLHPQSLKILRSSDLKPYVVFVAPPSLEKLRQKKIRNGEAFKEEDLKDTIEKAREMEDKYGHLFDMIIINNDTERAYHQLLNEINSLEREPQWVPASWLKSL
ncbi:protein PALS1-like isoform X2 [Macrosteles quadrilineatus]|nr:protein PALS1-like isoform X2 [Macrosteles quadrilineatus]XP_054261879.1 protein PALS1-like isoform X2 [Macrosteles quadrilineatus]